ncbi:hypothetical protein [Enterobacter asburiae]|uniref:hypothetical protein n=1 Tax=Enterobacter asburiae TaxID=61645 RepID=UPI003075F7A5
MSRVIKQVNVKATFPGGREVSGWTMVPPNKTDEAFQVWVSERADGSEATGFIINPSLAESVELTFQYETRDYGK